MWRPLGCVLMCAGAVLASAHAAAAQSEAPVKHAVYFNDKLIPFTPEHRHRGRMLVVGNSVVGPLARDHKASDHRPNLYIVSPGTQHQSDAGDEVMSYNLVISTLPRTSDPTGFDTYWALVLDPSLPGNFTSERELLLATQDAFLPGDLFEFEDIPSVALLRRYLHAESLADLDRFRRPDGTLPRVIIVPSGLVVRASAVDPDAPPPEGTLQRALSHISPRKTVPVQSVQSEKK